jgi:hypothetical protein
VFLGMHDLLHIYYDDTAVIAKAKELRAHSVDKPILRRYHVIRDYLNNGRIRMCKVHTDLNVADPLTTPLPQARFAPHQH